MRLPRVIGPGLAIPALAVLVGVSATVTRGRLEAAHQAALSTATVQARVESRGYPSVFQAWNPADNLPDDTWVESVARHDLVWGSPWFFGLAWASYTTGLATGFTDESVLRATETHEQLLRLNPNIVLIAEIRYRDASPSFLPEGHAWWLRTDEGDAAPGWEEGGYQLLDFSQPAYRAHVAARARAAVESGVVDGVLLDWWRDDEDRLALLREVRDAVGADALIIVNSNDRRVPASAPYANGLFMEAYRSADADDWTRIAQTLAWAESALREPRVNCLETWFHQSRRDLNLMRAATTLTLTTSDGYCLFSDPNPLPTPDHLHDWYPFWAKGLGRPVAAGKAWADGSMRREFEGGAVVYNPMGGRPVTAEFEETRASRATGLRSRTHTVAPADGDIFLIP